MEVRSVDLPHLLVYTDVYKHVKVVTLIICSTLFQ